MINLYGSDLIGRIDLSWTSQYDPEADEYVDVRSDTRKFYLKDHLGSIRQTLNESGTVTMAMDYYAFGATKSSYVVGSAVDKYKFTGKERDTETGLDYFGARYYDSKIGRWMSVDPLAEKFPGWSPYNYCKNNPLNLTDPDGKGPIPELYFWLFGSKMKEPSSTKQNNVQQTAKNNHGADFNVSAGVSATLFVFGGPHVEANIGISINTSNLLQSKIFVNGQGALIAGLGVGATAGIQLGMGMSKPASQGVSAGPSVHTEGGLGVGETIGGSVDVGLDQNTKKPESISGAMSTKYGVGAAGYFGTGPAYNVNVGVGLGTFRPFIL